ncbi:MAG: hypothetical protein K8R21_00120 [Leptospira sp.]|nr:hypothetical protein [Leptospira sp.]
MDFTSRLNGQHSQSVIRNFIYFLIVILPSIVLTAEKDFSAKVVWPLEFPSPISGTFTEFRNSSLHLGCDFKTYGLNGFVVKSVFDGYIETLSYSKTGYGLSINLFAPSSGLHAKYAHLNDLRGDLKGLDTLKMALMLLGSQDGFSLKLQPENFRTKAGATIAHTGETGSGISHLHLELFDSTGYYNPLVFPDFIQKDKTPPVIEAVYIDSESGENGVFRARNENNSQYVLEPDETLKFGGKLKLKIAGYDFITSRNHNSLFGLKLEMKNRILFEKYLDKVNFKEAFNRHLLYDINRSSLFPSHYVYNLFLNENEKNHSLDLSEFSPGSVIPLTITLFDANRNSSEVRFSILVTEPTIVVNERKKENKFSSSDGILNLDFSKTKNFGNGLVGINKLDGIDEKILIKGLEQDGDAYEIRPVNFNWIGKAKGAVRLKKKGGLQSVYLYDSEIKRWGLLALSKQNEENLKFEITHPGIIAFMKDTSPPKIRYPFMMNRNYDLSDPAGNPFIERFYSVSDIGAGPGERFEVYLDGQNYPYEFDRDRYNVKIEIPKSLRKKKDFLIVQLRAKDRAGNYSEWFIDLVKL